MSSLPITIISADIGPMNPALFRADDSILIPKLELEQTASNIISIIKRKAVNVVMIGSEYELEFFATHKDEIQSETGCLVVVSPLEAVQTANDKWLTTEFFSKHKIHYAECFVSGKLEDVINKADELGYPLMLKSRTGTSSRNVHIVRGEKDILNLFEKVPSPMLQRIISMPDTQLSHEYTCSVFKCSNGSILGPFTARRTLRWGSSWNIEVGDFVELHPVLIAIGEECSAMGTLNIQLMVGPEGPIPFELNSRFSGTTAIRAYYGFNEPEMVLRNYYLHETLSSPTIRKGLALRYMEEVFVEGISMHDLKPPFSKGRIKQWF
jgi:carbamoyl-phosphate synthase large subunit